MSRLKLYEEVQEDIQNHTLYCAKANLFRSDSVPCVRPSSSLKDKTEVFDKALAGSKFKDIILKAMEQLKSKVGNQQSAENPSKGDKTTSEEDKPKISPKKKLLSRVKIDAYKFNKYIPVQPDELFLQVYNFEQEIRKNDSDIYFKIKTFNLNNGELTLSAIQKFVRLITEEIQKNKRYYSFQANPATNTISHLHGLIEDLVFEITYPKIFKTNDDYE